MDSSSARERTNSVTNRLSPNGVQAHSKHGGDNIQKTVHSLAYAMTDSPVALMTKILEETGIAGLSSHSTDSPRSKSRERPVSARGPPVDAGQSICVSLTSPMQTKNQCDMDGFDIPWNPNTLITWTMMHWLPGPEMALNWLANSSGREDLLWASYSRVPLGITHYSNTNSDIATKPCNPVEWTEAYHRLVMIKRRDGNIRFAALERPMKIVIDIRELAQTLFASPSSIGRPVSILPSHMNKSSSQ